MRDAVARASVSRAQGGELFTVVHTPTSDGVPYKHALFYSACVVMGLGYLHAKSIAYRDLKVRAARAAPRLRRRSRRENTF